MRRLIVLLVGTLAATATATALADTTPPVSPVTTDACQPDPVLAQTAPDQAQRLHCRYGPLVVTPGTNLILFGPVSIESPRAEGFITRFAPDLVLASDGTVPAIHQVHLHHGVWLNPASERDVFRPFFATGEEKTVSAIPPGYGYPTHPTDEWVLNYMIHNLTSQTYEVFITYELDWLPAASGTQRVEPIWLDAVGHRGGSAAYPVYDPQKDLANRQGHSEDVNDDESIATDPDGRTVHRYPTTWTMNKSYRLIWAAGHVHPGGLRTELAAESCPGSPREIFRSEAQLNKRTEMNNGTGLPAGQQQLGSWDYLMTATEPGWEMTVRQGDQLSVTSVYDVSHPWYEAMGIMVAWGVPISDAEADPARCDFSHADTSGTATREAPEANSRLVFGGPGTGSGPTGDDATGAPVTRVDIAAFTYFPRVAPVAAGSTVSFVNEDAAAQIFHTVTACVRPCNGPTGQSYPLAEWQTAETAGFDSGVLGYGPPELTAATQQHRYDLDLTALGAESGDVITYYCRVHPEMRGALVVKDA